MKALIQRVRKGSVAVDGKLVGEVGRGLVVLLGVRGKDAAGDARDLAHKTVNLRIFPDAADRMNLSVQEVEGQVLVVSQFTLYADTRRGNRPSFVEAAPAEQARELYNLYVESLTRVLGQGRVATGVFGASMLVEIANDGPVTIELCTDRPEMPQEPRLIQATQ